MSIFTTIWGIASGLVGGPVSGGSEVVVSIEGDKITVAELTKGLKDLQAFNFSKALYTIERAYTDPSTALVDMETLAGFLADIGVPYAGDIDTGLKVAAFLLLSAKQAGLKIEAGQIPLGTTARGR